MNIPEELQYTKTDEWLRQDGDNYTIGITDYAQQELGEIVQVVLPEVGAKITAGDAFGAVDSIKAVSDLYAPVTGTVVKINENLPDDPTPINESPYDDGWMIVLHRLPNTPGPDTMDARKYREYREIND